MIAPGSFDGAQDERRGATVISEGRYQPGVYSDRNPLMAS